MENWSAVSGMIDVYRIIKEHIPRTSSPEKEALPAPVSLPVQEEQERIELYKTQLGPRHKILRKDILKLNRREMANFYGFKKTEKLERCEAGLDEFPTEAMKKLEKGFFVNPKYLQEGENYIFQTFRIAYTRDDCRSFLERDFRPYFLCGPSFQKDGLAYLVFCKQDEGYWQMVRSSTVGCFHSGSAGASNIRNLINAMLDLNMELEWPNTALTVSTEEWEKLENLRWYNKGMHGYLANSEAAEIYERWFREVQAKRMSRNSIFYEH
jgi:hypothetical protein